MNIVVVAAHPDDETCASGLLAKYTDEGHHVCIVYTTRGEGGGLGKPPLCARVDLGRVREQEAREAAHILGVQELVFLPYVDPLNDGVLHAVDVPFETFSRALQQVFERLLPGVIITHGSYGEYGHPQHIFTHQAVFQAVRQMSPWRPGLLLTWQAAHAGSTTPGETNPDDPADLLVDIRPWAARKLKAFHAHRTQVPHIEDFAREHNQPVTEFENEAYRTWTL